MTDSSAGPPSGSRPVPHSEPRKTSSRSVAATDGREFDVIVWGASGFTGRLTAQVLLERFGIGSELRWAIGGRDPAKLERVKKELTQESGIDAEPLEVLVGDSRDATFLDGLTARTRVVCTTVGPYSRFGSELVEACIRNATDYCDLTGEPHWIQRMIDEHQEQATLRGARIVFCCGFDCIPSDLGVFYLQEQMRARYGLPCERIAMRVKGFSGSVSGGTIASMLTMLEEADRDPAAARAMREPYALNPRNQRSGPDGPESLLPTYDASFRQWTTPFVMATIDTKVVRRSNALLAYRYGKDFRYDEAVLMGDGPLGAARAAASAAGVASMMGALSISPMRRVLGGFLPQPGDGPTKAQREKGYFDLHLRGWSADGHVLDARVRGDRDPGYGSTSRMLAASAVCLAQDELEVAGGLWTPASALGHALLARLPEAGVRFEIEDEETRARQ